MTPQQQDKLDSIEFGATADQTGADMVDCLTAHLLSIDPNSDRMLRFAKALERLQDALDDSRQSN